MAGRRRTLEWIKLKISFAQMRRRTAEWSFGNNFFQRRIIKLVSHVCVLCAYTCLCLCLGVFADGDLMPVGSDDSFTRFNIAMVQQYFREEAVHQQHKVLHISRSFVRVPAAGNSRLTLRRF